MSMKNPLSSSITSMSATLRRLFGFTRECRVRYIISMFLTSSRSMIKTIGLGLGAMLILDAAQGGDVQKTLFTIAWVLGICLTLVVLYSIGALWLDNCVTSTSATVRSLIIKHITRIPAAWYDKHHSGDIMSRMLTDMNSGMQNALNMPVQVILGIVMNGVASLTALFILEWRTALMIVAVSAVSLFLTGILAEPGRRASQKTRESNAQVSERLTDILAASTIIKVHGLYDYALGLLKDTVAGSEKHYLKQGHITALNELLGNVVRTVVYLGVMGIGIYSMSKGRLDAPQLIAVLQISSGPINMFMRIGSSFLNLQNALIGTQRVFDLLDVPVEAYDGHVELSENALPVRASDIRFGYDSENEIIRNKSITANKDKKTAFIGLSGGGKSTMLKLISGLYRCDGELRIFGQKIDDIPRGQLHDIVAYVPQFPHMFMGTVYDNIALAKPGSTREEVESAARRAGAHDFILALDGGYEYTISERGHNLSGGECQRVALARALLKHPQVLLLDEPTSALDLKSEALVTQSIDKTKDMTLIFATHRPSLLQIADDIIEIS